MPTLPSLSSERIKSKNLPPVSPAGTQFRRPVSVGGGWNRVRVLGSFPTGLNRSPSNSDAESGHGGPTKTSSLGGGGSLTVSRSGGPGGIGGGGKGDEERESSGRFAYALSSYEKVNKPRPYWEVGAEVVAKGASMPKKRLVPLLRELCIRTGDNTVCDGAFFGVLLEILRSAKDGDWDGKAVRLVHFFVRGMVTVQGDTEGRTLGSHWEGRGITPAQIMQAVECFREETEHRSTLRQIPAFQTLAMLCQLASEAGVGGQPSPVEVLKDVTLARLKSFQAQDRPDRGSKGKGRAHRQRLEAFQDCLEISSSIFSAIRRCPQLTRDAEMLPAVMAGCCSENPITARHAFAMLADQATQSPHIVSQTLLSKAMLIPTTVGMLQAPGDSGASGEEPNLADSLACVYYLRAIKALAFAESLDNTMRLDMYRTMVSSVPDARHRVALEAMQCLLDHPRAWELLVNAQRESRDADIFRRVVDRIKLCVEEATAPAKSATAEPTDGGAQSGGGRSRSFSPTRARAGGAGDSSAAWSRSGAGAQCNWALAHAACRVCRVVGRTFQVAISYQTMQSQNRTGTDDGSVSASAVTVLDPSGSSPRPPSIKLIGLSPGGGDGPVTPDARTSGTAFNLLGLPPSPAPRSGVTGASAWGQTVVEGLWGSGDVIAGQVVEEQNTAAIRDLCRALQEHRLLESPHLHVRSLALEAMFLLVPDPSPLDPQLRGLWDWLQQRVHQCPSSLPVSVLSELVDTLLTRVQCSAASRQEVIPIALSLTESFMYQVPSEEMGRCLLRAWCQCVGYGGRAREAVLQSIYRLLDRNIALPPEDPGRVALKEKGLVEGNNNPNSLGTGRPRFGTFTGGFAGESMASARRMYLRERSAATRTKRSAYWFLGEYCGLLTGLSTPSEESDSSPTLKPSAHSKQGSSAANELLDVWASITPARSAAATTGGFDVMEAAVPRKAAAAVAHPVVAAMNGATVSILLRLKHAAMFEDFQTRHTCASALCKIALRLPEPVRFDAYCFLKSLASSADIFSLLTPRSETLSNADGDHPHINGHDGVDDAAALKAYRGEQEDLMEMIDKAGAFGIGDVLTPVLDYLDCVYSLPNDGVTKEREFLDVYRRLLDGRRAAPSP